MRLEHAPDGSGEESGGWVGRATAAIGDDRRDGPRQRTERAGAQPGRPAVDGLEDHFPEQAAARRRRDASNPFVTGIAVGIPLRHLADQ